MLLPCSPNGKCPFGTSQRFRQLLLLLTVSGSLSVFTMIVGMCSCAPTPIFYACILASLVTIGASSHRFFSSPEHTESLGSGIAIQPHKALFQERQRNATRGEFSIAGTPLSYSLFDSLHSFSKSEWDNLLPEDHLFLRSEYLQALAKAPPANAEQRYGLLFHDDNTIGVAYFQLLTLSDDGVGAALDGKWLHRALRPGAALLGEDSTKAPVRLLICGNALLSGEHGFYYNDTVEPHVALDALGHMMKTLQRKEAKHAPVPLMAIKDFCADHPAHKEVLSRWGYHELRSEPMMVVTLREEWNNMDDYMAAMASKYRKRVRTARKKGKELVRQSMTEDEIKANAEEIQQLFDNVVQQAGFVLAALDIDGFVQMKRTFPESFDLVGYYLNEKLIGFNVIYIMGKHLDAHLVGLDYEHNLNVSLYQNMLYDFVEAGIEHGCSEVHMGRTALEIKSCVGAEPVDIAFYVKHPNGFLNRLYAPFTAIVPQTEWIQRHPFK